MTCYKIGRNIGNELAYIGQIADIRAAADSKVALTLSEESIVYSNGMGASLAVLEFKLDHFCISDVHSIGFGQAVTAHQFFVYTLSVGIY